MRQRDNWYIYSRDLNCTILLAFSREIKNIILGLISGQQLPAWVPKRCRSHHKGCFCCKFLLESIENLSAMLAFLSYHTLGFTIAATLVCFNSCSLWLCQHSLCTIFLSGNIFSKKIATKLYSGNQPCVRCIHNQDEHCSKEFFARRLPQPN